MNDQKSNPPSELPAPSVPSTLNANPTVPETPPGTAESTSKLDTLEPKSSEESKPNEIGGQKGPEPTRYGDWEKNGRCTDF